MASSFPNFTVTDTTSEYLSDSDTSFDDPAEVAWDSGELSFGSLRDALVFASRALTASNLQTATITTYRTVLVGPEDIENAIARVGLAQ